MNTDERKSRTWWEKNTKKKSLIENQTNKSKKKY